MNPNEVEWLLHFLEDLGDKYGNAGCNDMSIPNTPENMAMVKRMIASGDYPNNIPQVYRDKIDVFDYELLSYLQEKLENLETWKEATFEALESGQRFTLTKTGFLPYTKLATHYLSALGVEWNALNAFGAPDTIEPNQVVFTKLLWETQY